MKVLLMGRAGAGKTSMKSVIFGDYSNKDTMLLTPTPFVEQSHFTLFGNHVLTLWDCGGQDAFMQSYLTQQKNEMFANARVLVYVFEVRVNDVPELLKADKKVSALKSDKKYWKATRASLNECSPEAMVFVLVHKTDVLGESETVKMVVRKWEEHTFLTATGSRKPLVFGTSIFDESLWYAWSQIMRFVAQMPLQMHELLERFLELNKGDVVALLERGTFLAVETAEKVDPSSNQSFRFEDIALLCKKLRLSSLRQGKVATNISIYKGGAFLFVEPVGNATMLLFISRSGSVPIMGALCNIDLIREAVEEVMRNATA